MIKKNGGPRPGAGRKPKNIKVKSWPVVVIHIDPDWLATMPKPRAKYIREAIKTRMENDGFIDIVNLF